MRKGARKISMKPENNTGPDPGRAGRRFRVGVRFPDWAIGFAFRFFDGLLEFRRMTEAIDLHFDHPSGGDLPSEPVGESWEGDGLLVFRHTSAEAAAWKSRGIAVVNLSTVFPDRAPDFPQVAVDNQVLGRAAAEHLATLGLRNFAYIHESARPYSHERLESFRETVGELGGRLHCIEVPASEFPAEERPRRIEQCMAPPLMALPRPCGILAKDDIAAIWTLRLLKKLGIDCPGEMPVLGVSGDAVFCHMADPPLSSIPHPARRIGFAAAKLLWRMMAGEQVPPGHRIAVPPGAVVPRESTRHVALADPVATRAMEIIRRESADGAISVAKLSRQVGVSRENLRQRFHTILGHSPKREIERQRGHHIRELLQSEHSTLDEIAEQSGFPDAAELCRFIKRTTGKTPGTIRKELRRNR